MPGHNFNVVNPVSRVEAGRRAGRMPEYRGRTEFISLNTLRYLGFAQFSGQFQSQLISRHCKRASVIVTTILAPGYKSAVEFRPRALHVYANNDLPTFRSGMDRGVMRRLAMVTFHRTILTNEGIDVPPTLLHQDSDLGRGYLAAMDLAGRYAYAGRDWMAATVLDILGAGQTDGVHNQHNFAWREDVAGAPAWLPRTGEELGRPDLLLDGGLLCVLSVLVLRGGPGPAAGP